MRSGPVDTLPGRASLKPNPPILVLGREARYHSGELRLEGGRDPQAYGAEIFPAQPVLRGRISNRRGLLVLHLRHVPLRYRHSAGELLLDRQTEVLVHYRLRDERPPAPDAQLLPHLAAVANADQAAAWYQARLADTAAKPGYAIVIPDVLSSASTRLEGFVKVKEAQGLAVTIVKDADRAAIKIKDGEGDAERIRGWLQQNYKALNLTYLLLVGNPDPRRPGVPMKLVSPLLKDLTTDEKEAPSDYYYADLTGNWDLDGDGKFGEYPDDKGDAGVDFTPEVLVGRIPIYDSNVSVLDKVLDKLIGYATEGGDRAWRKRVLQPAAMLFYKGEYNQPSLGRMDGAAAVADPIWDQAIKDHGFTRFRLYEKAGLDPSKAETDAPLSQENVIAEWKKGYGLVTMVGHGSSDAIWRHVFVKDDDSSGWPNFNEVDDSPFLTYDSLRQLDDTRPSIVFHNSCSNGTPEDADNLGAGLLRQGAIATVSSTRVAYVVQDTSIFNLARDSVALLLDNHPLGDSLFQAKVGLATGTSVSGIAWFTVFEANLYGDPSTSLVACVKDADCDDGKLCNGKETCQAGACVAGKAVVCKSDDPCTEQTCQEPSGACSGQARPDGEACDDQQFCTFGEVCQAGKCVGSPRCAAPGNPCVAATCDEAKKSCDVQPVLEGERCHEGTDRVGTCRKGICEPDSSGCSVSGAGAAGLPLVLALLGLLVGLRRTRCSRRA